MLRFHMGIYASLFVGQSIRGEPALHCTGIDRPSTQSQRAPDR